MLHLPEFLQYRNQLLQHDDRFCRKRRGYNCMLPILYFKTPTISYVTAINFQRNPFLKQVMQIEGTQVSATPLSPCPILFQGTMCVSVSETRTIYITLFMVSTCLNFQTTHCLFWLHKIEGHVEC